MTTGLVQCPMLGPSRICSMPDTAAGLQGLPGPVPEAANIIALQMPEQLAVDSCSSLPGLSTQDQARSLVNLTIPSPHVTCAAAATLNAQ